MGKPNPKGLLLVWGLVLVQPVAAQFPVPPPFIESSALTSGGYKNGSSFGSLNSNYQLLGNPDVLEHAEASLINVGVPLVFADAEASGPGSSATADSTIEYFFQASGPKNVVVPLIIQVNGLSTKVERSGGGSGTIVAAESRMWITNDDNFQNTDSFSSFYDSLAQDPYGSGFSSSNNFQTLTVVPTRANVDRVSITLDAHAAVWTGVNFSGKATAMLDPLVYVDPSFPDAALYSVVVSAGMPNSPVPEPSPRVLLLAGSLLLAARRLAQAAGSRIVKRTPPSGSLAAAMRPSILAR